jgi:hypothetical protein
VVLGFIGLAMFYDLTRSEGFSTQEAMESAHLARQLAEGKGYKTDSIRPFCLHLLQEGHPAQAQQVLQPPVPDLSVPPAYPCLLAAAMKVLPFNFTTDPNQPWTFKAELWIRAINELLFLAAAFVLFQVARRLFDTAVAWLSAILFAGTELFWRFSASGQSTIWLILIFLGMVWCLVVLEERERRPELPRLRGSLGLAAAAGVLAGIGGLSRYSFAWMIVPVVILVLLCVSRARVKLCVFTAVAFLAVMGPWIGRNLALSHTCFGSNGYALVETTPHLPDDLLERSLQPDAMLGNVMPRDVLNKLIVNEGDILRNSLPRLGGNWVSAFFLCGLLLPFRNPALKRFRLFLLGSLVLMAVVQGACQTHLSADSPEINSENMLVVLSPLVFVFGAGVFLTLLDPIIPPDPRLRRGVSALFVLVVCAPLLVTLLGPFEPAAISPYAPAHIQGVAAMMEPEELMMSDIPWAVAWYGERPCVWLTPDDGDTYKEVDKLKAVQAIFLTQRTSDRRFLSQMIAYARLNTNDWNRFYLDSLPTNLFTTVPVWARGEVPTGFPLRKAILDYAPDQMFITDRNRWQTAPKKR